MVSEAEFKDWRWRLNHLYRVVDKQGEKVRFQENIVQEQINDDDSLRRIILKARQFGVSTNELLKLLDYVMWTPNKTVAILAHEQDAIQKLFRIVRRAYKFLDPNIRPQLERGGGSKYEMFFPEHNSRIYCDLESRGDTIHRLHVSEMAFMKDPKRLMATIEAVPIHTGTVTVETTPNGMGNHFYDFWNSLDLGYSKHFFPWYFFPEYALESTVAIQYTDEELEMIQKAKRLFGIDISPEQMAFRRFKKSEARALGDVNHFIQEYPEDDQSCFLSTGEAVMDLVLVKQLIDDLAGPIYNDGTMEIYEEYIKDHIYVIGADTAEGVGGDFSVATVFDAVARRQVAQVRGQIKPSDFAHLIHELAKKYRMGGRRWPMVGVERNNHGHAVLLELDEHINYPHLFKGKDDRPGWITDRVSRPIMLNAFRDGVDNGTMALRSATTLSECMTLISNKGKIEAAKGKHDDSIIASSIALQMCIEVQALDVYTNIGKKIRM